MVTILLPDEYRILDTFGGWILEYKDPCLENWHELAIRDTLRDAEEAYARICDGEDVSLWPS